MDYKRFLNCLEKAINIAPGHPLILYDLARAYALTGNRAQALACLEKVADIGGIAAFNANQEKEFASLIENEEFKRILQKIESMKAPVINSEIAYIINERDLVPESLSYDPSSRTLYLGSIRNRKIVSIDEQGAVKDFISQAQDGIWGVSGIEIDAKRRVLWAAANSGNTRGRVIGIEEKDFWNAGVFKFDLNTGMLIRKYILEQKESAHLLNDLVVTRDGDLFITDTLHGAVYMISAGKDEMQLFLKTPRLKFATGIALSDDEQSIFVAHGFGIDLADLTSGHLYPLSYPEDMTLTGIDGLSFHKKSLIAHQISTLGRVSRYYLSDDLRSVERMETIDAHRPDFNTPRAGTVASNLYYYVANSQMDSFRDGKAFPMNQLQRVLVLKAKL